jgi:hypothetical protein
MNRVEEYVYIQSGKVQLRNPDRYNEAVRSLADGLYLNSITKVYDNRTGNQNRYYWGVVIKAFVDGTAEEWGDPVSAEEAHDFLKEKFNFSEHINEDTGEAIRIPRSTADISTVEFTQYIERCRLFIEEWFHIEIPDPE